MMHSVSVLILLILVYAVMMAFSNMQTLTPLQSHGQAFTVIRRHTGKTPRC